MSHTQKESQLPSSCKISVICVTNRIGAGAFLEEQLSKQTFKDFEVIIADDSEELGWHEGWDWFWPRQKDDGDVWNINKAYNDCLSMVNGELIVFLQDFIEIKANGLQRFWDLYQLYPNDLITGCGHKYEDEKIVETDDRCFGERTLVPSDWTYYELNWASCPTHIAPRFDESMDKFYGGENQIFALNSKAAVWLDRTNECKGEAHYDRPENWEAEHTNKNGRLNEKILECQMKS